MKLERVQDETAPRSTRPGIARRRCAHRGALFLLPEELHDPSGPVFGDGRRRGARHDLTRQHAGEPLGERIIVTGRVLDSGGQPIPNTLVEVWQANAAGRYAHEVDRHPAPLDPNFTGAGRCLTDADGRIASSPSSPAPTVAEPPECVAAGSHPLLRLRPRVRRPARDADVLPGRPALRPRPDLPVDSRPGVSRALISRFDLEATEPEWALAYRWDIVLRSTPFE